MSTIEDGLVSSKLASGKEYRDAVVASFLKQYIAFQIRTIRKKRGLTQPQLANAAHITQGVISRAEDPDYGNLTFNTVLRIAAGFDLAFVGEFVRFSDFQKTVRRMSEAAFDLPSFAAECELEAAVCDEVCDDAAEKQRTASSPLIQGTMNGDIPAGQEPMGTNAAASASQLTGESILIAEREMRFSAEEAARIPPVGYQPRINVGAQQAAS